MATISPAPFPFRGTFKGSLHDQLRKQSAVPIDVSLYALLPEDKRVRELAAEAKEVLIDLKSLASISMEDPIAFWGYYRRIDASLQLLPSLVFPSDSKADAYLTMIARLSDLYAVLESTLNPLSQSSLTLSIISNQISQTGLPFYMVGKIDTSSVTGSMHMALHRLKYTATLAEETIKSWFEDFNVQGVVDSKVFDASALMPHTLASFYDALIMLQLAYLNDANIHESVKAEIKNALTCFLESFSHVHLT